jgi:hypothetical protein
MSEPVARSPLWGFRISIIDTVVIVAAAVGAIWLRRMDNPIWWVIATVIGHFFLFCNVVRMRRRFELTWAILFILNIAFWIWTQNLSGLRALACQLPITAALVVAELRSPRYHGIFANHWNPQLNEYLIIRQTEIAATSRDAHEHG